MPLSATPARVVTEPERDCRTRLTRFVTLIHERAFAVVRHRNRAQERQVRRATLDQRHPEFANANFRHIAMWIGFVLALLFIWLGDIVFSWPTSEYYGRHLIPSAPPWLIAAWCLVLPTAVFFVELLIAGQRVSLKEQVIEGLPGAWYGLTFLAAGMVAAIAGFVVAAQMAANAVTGASSTPAMLRIAAVTLVTVILHSVVVFSGRAMHDAKGYVFYLVRARRLRAQADASRSAAGQGETAVTRLYIAYRRELDEAKAAFPSANFQEGPFQQTAVGIINGAGPAATEAPAGPASTAATPSGPASSANDNASADSASASDNRSTRDADAEVIA